jgi:hypothetical protein
MTVNDDTLEELDTLLYGRADTAKRSSVKIYERSAVARRVDFNTKVALGSQKKHQENMKVTLDRAPWEKSDENS